MTYEPGPKRQMVLDLIQKGKTPREVAEILRISTARVYQHIDALRERGLLKDSS